MGEKLLSVSNISISFTQYVEGLRQTTFKVVNDLSLDINKGEIVAILGSSGSGKSLLAEAILGILPKNASLSGEIKYKNQVLTQELKEKVRGDEISLIPQSVKYLDPLMKISQQVIGECSSKEEFEAKKKKQRKIFEEYGLSEEVDNMYPFQLSGGMARRVLVSTAILSDPELVIADEPTPGLDEEATQETLNYLKGIADNGAGVLLITHDIEAALEIADRIAIFYAGYVIEIANIEDFDNNGANLSHPYTIALYEALPQNKFAVTLGHQPLTDELGNNCPYLERCKCSLDICSKEIPTLKNHQNKKVKCFLYDKEE